MKTKLVLFGLLLSGLFFSCQKEVSLENGSGNGGGTGGNGGGGGTGGGGTTGCKDCVYIPMCDGAWYTYYDTIMGTSQIASDTLKYVKDTTINNLVFRKFNSAAQQNSSYVNCTNGTTKISTFNAVSAGGNTVSRIDLTLLKANQPVGTTWTDTITNPLGQQVLYMNTITEKAVSRTVNGQTFADAIHVYIETGIDLPVIGFFLTNTTDYYYAKGVGLIEAVITDPNSGTVIQHRTLKAYFIP